MSAAIVDRLTLSELSRIVAQPTERDPKPLEGYWHGSAGGHVRALEAENRRLRARVAELEGRLQPQTSAP